MSGPPLCPHPYLKELPVKKSLFEAALSVSHRGRNLYALARGPRVRRAVCNITIGPNQPRVKQVLTQCGRTPKNLISIRNYRGLCRFEDVGRRAISGPATRCG